MKLNVSRLRKEPGAQESFRFVLTKEIDTGEARVIKPVRVEGMITNTGHLLRLTAAVSTVVLASCSRCLDDVEIPLDLEFTEYYCHESEMDYSAGDAAEKNDVIVFQEEWLDLSDAVKENIILHLPMQILCDSDCPGMCPHCGSNLKNGKCECREVEIDPRLAILEKLKNN